MDIRANKIRVPEIHGGPKGEVIWTAPKAALIELLYGLHSAGVFNQLEWEIGQIARYLQYSFAVISETTIEGSRK